MQNAKILLFQKLGFSKLLFGKFWILKQKYFLNIPSLEKFKLVIFRLIICVVPLNFLRFFKTFKNMLLVSNMMWNPPRTVDIILALSPYIVVALQVLIIQQKIALPEQRIQILLYSKLVRKTDIGGDTCKEWHLYQKN